MDESESSNAQSSREEPPQHWWHRTEAGFRYFIVVQVPILRPGSVFYSYID